MKRWVWLLFFVSLGLVSLVCGLLVPAHLRAVDASVIQRAGWKSRTLVEEGITLVNQQKVGPARLFAEVAQQQNLPGKETLGLAVGNFGMMHPRLLVWGAADPVLTNLFASDPHLTEAGSQPFIQFVVRVDNREMLLEYLRGSRLSTVQELLKCRSLTNTVLFPPSGSSAGQALDAAIALAGLLLQGDHLSPAMREQIVDLAREANRGGDPQKLELVLFDLMSLGRRMNWGQLANFVRDIDETATLRHLTRLVRKPEADLPVVFSAVHLSGRPAAVADYLMEFSETGTGDLSYGLRAGLGGVRELLQRKERIHYPSDFRDWLVTYDPFGAFFYAMLDWCYVMPRLALVLKYLFFLVAGFFFAQAFPYAKSAVPSLERPLVVRGFAAARHGLFAVFFLLVILLLSEPFLAQESQKVEFPPFRLQLPKVGSAIPAGATQPVVSTVMNQLTILALLLFFVLQALLYSVCLIKLAEIRRQHVPPRMKLKLLENEDHLFDAGLYLGFVGTIISLVLMSLGVVKPSLMAGYSSTSFGIIFVSVLKIFHVRPLRRKLILESEASTA